MSVINQMLRDLEQRKTTNVSALHKLEAQAWPIEHRSTTGRYWLIVLIFLGLPAVWWVWGRDGNFSALLSVKTEMSESPAKLSTPTAAPTSGVEQLAPVATAIAGQLVPEITNNLNAVSVPASEITQVVNQVSQTTTGDTKTVETAQLKLETPTALPQTPVPTKVEAVQQAKQQVERVLPPTVEPLPSRTATPRPAKIISKIGQVEALYQRAKRAGSPGLMEENLYEALQIDPFYLPARTLLLETLIKAGASDLELARYVDESLSFFPSNVLFLKTRAHLFVKQRDFEAAVHTLEKVDIDGVNDTGYLSLIGAAYQQLNRPSGAERVYRQLTGVQPDKAENWLGLAMAEEKLGQNQAAEEAYRHARDIGTLKPEVVEYIDQRMSALN